MTLSEHTPWEAAKLQGNLSIPFRGMHQSIRPLVYMLVYTLGCVLWWEGDWSGTGRQSWSQVLGLYLCCIFPSCCYCLSPRC